MNKLQKNKIIDFIDSLIENDYKTANENLNIVFEQILKDKIQRAKGIKVFEKAESECEDCEDKNTKSKKSDKSDKKPAWLKKIARQRQG